MRTKTITLTLGFAALSFMCVSTIATREAVAGSWANYPVPGCVTALASTPGINYAVGCNQTDGAGNLGIYRSQNHGPWVAMSGSGVSIAAAGFKDWVVDVVNAAGEQYFMGEGETFGFRQYPNGGCARSMAQWTQSNFLGTDQDGPYGPSGEWKIDCTPNTYGYGIAWRGNSSGAPGTVWTPLAGGATKIAVSVTGAFPWAINNVGTIFKYDSATATFQPFPVPGLARDIAVASSFSTSDDVWVVGWDNHPYQYTTALGSFAARGNIVIDKIAVGGDILAGDSNHQVYYYVP